MFLFSVEQRETKIQLYRETFTLESFQAFEISPQLANQLEIRILFSWRPSLVVVLGLELLLDHFEEVPLIIFEMAD